MAVILCSKHGKQGCVLASHHFVDSVNNKKEYTGKLYILELNTFVGASYHWVDEGFLKENNVCFNEESQQIKIIDEEVSYNIFADLTPVCCKCYDEYLSENNLFRPDNQCRL